MLMDDKSPASIDQGKEAALRVLLHNARGPCQGLPRAAGWGYPEPYTRDLMISALGFLATGNEELADALRRTLVALATNQTKRGHIPSLAHDPADRGSSDTTPLFLFCLALYRRSAKQPEFLDEAARKALIWMQYQSPDDLVMVAQLPTSDWRDEQWVMGFGLYVNTLVYGQIPSRLVRQGILEWGIRRVSIADPPIQGPIGILGEPGVRQIGRRVIQHVAFGPSPLPVKPWHCAGQIADKHQLAGSAGAFIGRDGVGPAGVTGGNLLRILRRRRGIGRPYRPHRNAARHSTTPTAIPLRCQCRSIISFSRGKYAQNPTTHTQATKSAHFYYADSLGNVFLYQRAVTN